MNDLSLRLLRAFATLAVEGQFRRAAEKFHVSQSAFSQMIAKLEEQVGVQLVVRDSRNMTLTPEGELLVPLAEEMHASADAIVRKLKDHAQGAQGSVTFGALPALTMDWIPSIMAKYRRAAPHVRVRLLDSGDLDSNWRLLREHQVDFLLHPNISHTDEFESTPLFEERFFLICQPGHPLTQRKRVLLKDLAGEPYIRLEPSGSLAYILDPLLAQVALANTGLAMGYHNSIAGLISNGFGITVVPGFSTLHYRLCGLTAVPLQDAQLRRRFVVLKRRGEAQPEVVVSLLKLIADSPPPHALPYRAPKVQAARAKRARG